MQWKIRALKPFCKMILLTIKMKKMNWIKTKMVILTNFSMGLSGLISDKFFWICKSLGQIQLLIIILLLKKILVNYFKQKLKILRKNLRLSIKTEAKFILQLSLAFNRIEEKFKFRLIWKRNKIKNKNFSHINSLAINFKFHSNIIITLSQIK